MPPILKIYIYYFRVLHRKPRHQEHPQNVRKVQELIQSFLFCLWSVEAAKAPQAPNVGPSKKVLEMHQKVDWLIRGVVLYTASPNSHVQKKTTIKFSGDPL